MADLLQFRKPSILRLMKTIAYSALAVGLSADAASVQPSSPRSASASLRISVTVVPVVGTPPSQSLSPSSDSIVYRMEGLALARRYEVRNLPPERQNARATKPAVLKTLIVVPR